MAKTKNEAKIKFTAETHEFNEAIKQSDSQMAELRAEMKLNEAQMDNAGKSAEGLERKHELLQKQLHAAGEKTEALANKLKSTERYFGSNSDEASRLRTQLSNAKTAQTKLEGAVSDCADELRNFGKKMDDAGDASKDASGGFTVAKDALGDFISDSVQAGIDKVGEFVNYLADLPKETREARQGMAIVDTAFAEAGLSAEQGKQTVRELYSVLGDNDRAIEASSLIAKMSSDQDDLNGWVRIATGIFGTYGESLPIESLAESTNETIKSGKVTGSLADALNWSSEAAEMFSQYMSDDVTTAEDAFNVALSKCTSEEERQSLITKTLTALYGEAAGKYKETASSVIEANEATYDLAQTENELGAAIEPVTTSWDGLKNQLLSATLPAVEKISGALTKCLNWLGEHPAVLKAAAAAFAVLSVGLGVVAVAWGIYTVAQLAANAAMLPWLGIALLIIVIIAAVVAAGVLLYQNWDVIKAKCIEVWETVKTKVSTVVENVKTAISNAWTAIKDTTTTIFNAIKTAVSTVWNGIKTTVSTVVNGIKTAVSTAWNWIKTSTTNIWNGIKNAISSVVNGVKTTVSNVWNGVKNATSTAFNAVKRTASNAWNNVKTTVSNVVTNAKTSITGAWDNIKSKTTSVFNSIKSTATRVWNNIKSAITSPIEKAKEKVRGVIDSIKGFFNFDFSWPKIPMPHFGITPEGWKIGDLLNGTIPKLGIEWYASGGILTRPTAFGVNGNNLMVGGEAGPEAILPINRLEGYIANAVEKHMNVVNLEALATSIEELASRPISLNINGREFAIATAGAGDSVNGMRTTFKSRGLALE